MKERRVSHHASLCHLVNMVRCGVWKCGAVDGQHSSILSLSLLLAAVPQSRTALAKYVQSKRFPSSERSPT